MKKTIIILLLFAVSLTGCLRAGNGNPTETERECEAYTYEDETSPAETTENTAPSETETQLPDALQYLRSGYLEKKDVSFQYNELSGNWECILTYNTVASYEIVTVRLEYPDVFNKVTVEWGKRRVELPWATQFSYPFYFFHMDFEDITGDGYEDMIMTTSGTDSQQLCFVFDLERWEDLSPVYIKDDPKRRYLKEEYTALLLQAYQEECERCGVEYGYWDYGISNINEDGELVLDRYTDKFYSMCYRNEWWPNDDKYAEYDGEGKILMICGSGSPIPQWHWEIVFAFTEEGCVAEKVTYTIYPEEEAAEGE